MGLRSGIRLGNWRLGILNWILGFEIGVGDGDWSLGLRSEFGILGYWGWDLGSGLGYW